MITEEQFTSAMEAAVAQRGESWRYPDPLTAPPGYYNGGHSPTYSDHRGNPTCLIGAVLHVLGMRVPSVSESPSCLSFLIGPLSHKVAMAARCAQVHQDNRQTWGEALDVYRAALEIQESEGDYTVFASLDLYYKAVHKARGHMVTRVASSVAPKVETFEAAIAAMSKASTSVSASMGAFAANKVTIALPEGVIKSGTIFGGTITWSGSAVTTAAYFTEGEFKSVFPTKAEHALTA